MFNLKVNKSLAIFCFYDSEGKVHGYVKYLIKQLKEVADELIIVVNGNVEEKEFDDVKKYINKILIRENRGFDGAAYKYAFSHLNDIQRYSRIILCNDSFFGPIDDFRTIFSNMTNKNYDFWGLRYVDNGLIDYLESYFLVFEKNIVCSENLQLFFNKSQYMDDAGYLEICSCFERGLFSFLRDKNYKFGAYSINNDNDIFYSADANLIRYHVPIIKRKILNFDEYGMDQFKRILNFVEVNSDYPIELILEYLGYKYKKSKVEINLEKYDVSDQINEIKIQDFSKKRDNLIEFICNNPLIYIYGTGFHAGNIWFEYNSYFKSFRGFIQSDEFFVNSKKYFNEEVVPISTIPIGSSIILAIGRHNESDVYNNIYKKYNVFSIWR